MDEKKYILEFMLIFLSAFFSLPLHLEARVHEFYAAKNVTKCEQGITLDGKLEEPAWQKGEWIKGFNLLSGEKPSQQTEFCIVYGEKNLYIGIKCYEEKMRYLRAKIQVHDGQIWLDDCVEVFFSPPECESYYHFIVNTIGAKYEETAGNSTWNGVWDAAGFKDKDYWSMEIIIPFSTIDVSLKEDSVWGMNVCRARYSSGPTEYSYWSTFVGDGGFCNPESFGNLIFEGFNPTAYFETDLNSLNEKLVTAKNMLKKASPQIAKQYKESISAGTLQMSELKRFLIQKENFTTTEMGDFSRRLAELSKKTETILRRLSIKLLLE